MHKRVLVVAFEKQSESNATWALSMRLPFTASLVVGAGGYFAPVIRAYMRRSGAPDHIGMMVAVKDRQNALKNPYAHLKIPDIARRWSASRRCCGTRSATWRPARPRTARARWCWHDEDGRRDGTPNPPAWVHGAAMRSEPTMGRRPRHA